MKATMTLCCRHVFACLLLCMLPMTVMATDEVRYVTDRVLLPLHSDKSEKSRLLNKNLTTGSTVKVLKEDAISGFSQVDAGKGVQGWILTRYLTREPTSAARLATMEKKLSSASDNGSPKEIATLKEENKKLLDQNRATQQQLDDIRQAAGNVSKLMEQNRELIEKTQILQSKVDTLEAVKEKIRDNNNMDQFIYGGLLVIATLVVSTLIESFRRRRSYSSWG